MNSQTETNNFENSVTSEQIETFKAATRTQGYLFSDSELEGIILNMLRIERECNGFSMLTGYAFLLSAFETYSLYGVREVTHGAIRNAAKDLLTVT